MIESVLSLHAWLLAWVEPTDQLLPKGITLVSSSPAAVFWTP